uniref:kelch repeat-containing protein n=1 Tax=Actinophytocola algeriensis TaxID=1768010 RepID=UPI0035E2C464
MAPPCRPHAAGWRPRPSATGSTPFGGEGNPAPGSNHIFRETEVYDTRKDQWKKLAPMPLPRHGTAAAAIDGTIYIPGGGHQAGGAPVDVVDAYRPR